MRVVKYNRKCELLLQKKSEAFQNRMRKEMKGNLTQIVNTHKKKTCEYKGMRKLKDHRKGH